VPVLLKPGSTKIDSLLSRTETPQNKAVCYILLRPEILKLTSWLRSIFAEGGAANCKRGFKRNEFNLTSGSRLRRECNGDADIGRGLGSAQRWV
jgi:hypothetical protein